MELELSFLNRSGQRAAFDIFAILANRATTAEHIDMLKNVAAALGSSERIQSLVILAESNVQWQAAKLNSTADILYTLTNTPDPDLPTTTTPSPTTTPVTVTTTTEPPTTSAAPTTHGPSPPTTTPLPPKPTEGPNAAGGLTSCGVLLATALVAAIMARQ